MKPEHSRYAVGLAACFFELQRDTREVQLFPAGRFRALDGRPADVAGDHWYIDAAIAQRLISAAQARANPFVIDYEHQTLNAEKNGQPAPAAGWWQNANMEWRAGQGLFAVNIDWTAKARAMIAAGEYKFFSPVFKYDKQSGAVTEILMGAVTNFPALDGMEALAARFGAVHAGEIVKSLRDEIAALSAEVIEREVNDMIVKAVDEGRLLSAMKAWAQELGKKDIAQLRVFIGAQLSNEQRAVCLRMGLNEEEYKKNARSPGRA